MQDTIQSLISQQQLPSGFEQLVESYYAPLAAQMARVLETRRNRGEQQTWLVGVQGTQGSGKSTCSLFLKHLLEKEFQLSVVVLSIDDFYLTRAERLTLSQEIHPLLKTRGVPGTHDVDLIQTTLHQLSELPEHAFMLVPRFDKATDDRKPKAKWDEVEGKIDVILFEGWCVGLDPQMDAALSLPINELEATEDADGAWRQFVNQKLKQEYAELYAQLDDLIILQAPSFKVVHEWRLLQEQKLKEKMARKGVHNLQLMSPDDIHRFISHYQRLTEHGLITLPHKARWVLELDDQHAIVQFTINGEH